MGLLAGNTGFKPFNSYTSAGDGNSIETGWSQLNQLAVADSPDNTTSGNCAINGWSTSNAPFDIFYSRIEARDFQGVIPFGAFIEKIQIQTRSSSTFIAGNTRGYAYDFDLIKLNNTFGNNKLFNLLLVEASTAGNPLRVDTFGNDNWGVNIGYGSIINQTSGVNYRVRMTEGDSGNSGSSQGILLDYLFMDVTYKQTGVMMAM